MYDYVKNKENEKFLKITICDDNQTVFQSNIRKLGKIPFLVVVSFFLVSDIW